MASDSKQLAWLVFTTLGDLIRAVIELGIARLRLRSLQMKTLATPPCSGLSGLRPDESAKVERVAFAIPRVAIYLPWRADCLVQALAAKRWLARTGITTALHVGVKEDCLVKFEAHAWLTAGDRVVTGGQIIEYLPLRQIRPSLLKLL